MDNTAYAYLQHCLFLNKISVGFILDCYISSIYHVIKLIFNTTFYYKMLCCIIKVPLRRDFAPFRQNLDFSID